jgi:hypothetical protein
MLSCALVHRGMSVSYIRMWSGCKGHRPLRMQEGISRANVFARQTPVSGEQTRFGQPHKAGVREGRGSGKPPS